LHAAVKDSASFGGTRAAMTMLSACSAAMSKTVAHD
jgi:hypothetical protein